MAFQTVLTKQEKRQIRVAEKKAKKRKKQGREKAKSNDKSSVLLKHKRSNVDKAVLSTYEPIREFKIDE
ncbi:hypothetical protein OAA_13840 [Vibrio cyclitrophicus 1F175]|uniref:hypothetical protein n=1 Tax=Vibrio TaxID=662 RepID=UPI000302A4D8|nr:hypothetical protein [Vibrio cyclitrophicus]OEF63563.1 hypothetical protein OAA_13840 [Vibrio cyclitrophicus 1F175]